MAEQKLPPQNVEAEQATLGAILLDPDAIIKVADILIPPDFYRPDHATIFGCMLELYEDRLPIDLVTLTDRLEKKKKLKQVGGAAYLTNLVNAVSSSAHVAQYAEIVQQKSTLRKLITASTKIIEDSYKEDEDVPIILDRAEQSLFAVSERYLKEAFIPIREVLAESFERIDELHKNKGKLRGIGSGFRGIDNLLAGFQRSDFILLAARPSMGKTSLALNIAIHSAIIEKVPVGVFSLEMSKDQLVDRLLTMEAGIDSWKLRTGNLSDEDFPKLNRAMGELSEAPLYIDDSPLLGVMDMRTKARRLQAEHGLGLLIVDYLQLMEGRTRHYSDVSRVQEVSDISRALKALARELNIPLIAVSQLSRAVEARSPRIPQLSDLRESGCLTGNTLIFNSRNGQLIPIKELVKDQSLVSLSLDEKKKLVPQKVSRVFPTGRKRIFELRLASGKKIRATGNHKFLTIDGWKRLDELSLGEKLATPRIIAYQPDPEIKLSDEKVILLAHLIGDGCYLPRQPLHYTNADTLCLEVVDKVSKKAFATHNRWVRQENWYHLYLSSPFQLARGKRNPIVRWLDEELKIYGQRSGEKRIPSQIFSLPLNQIALFIRHLFATDGSINKASGQWRLFYASKSRGLVDDLQHLLLRFGIHSRIAPTFKKNYAPVYFLTISGKEDQLKFLKEIGIFGKKANLVQKATKELEELIPNPNVDIVPKEIWSQIVSKFQAKGWSTRNFHSQMGWAYSGTQRYGNGLSRKRLAKVATVLHDEPLKELARSDIFWEEIMAIAPQGVEEVYDMTVPLTHNFIANSIIVHNSLEQDSDVVMFIYREDYYEPETDKKGIAQILIRKHRNGPTGDIELYFHPQYSRFANLEKERVEEKETELQKIDEIEKG